MRRSADLNRSGKARAVPKFCESPALEEVFLQLGAVNAFQSAPVIGARPGEPGSPILPRLQPPPTAPFPGPRNAPATYREPKRYAPRGSYIRVNRRSGPQIAVRDTPDRWLLYFASFPLRRPSILQFSVTRF